MTTHEYQELAIKTEAPYDKAKMMMAGGRQIRLMHGAVGLATESGELLDTLKKHVYYQKMLDTGNLAEELGDILWYVAIICSEMGWPMEEIMRMNIDKLRLRYPNKFTKENANVRDLDAEQGVFKDL